MPGCSGCSNGFYVDDGGAERACPVCFPIKTTMQLEPNRGSSRRGYIRPARKPPKPK